MISNVLVAGGVVIKGNQIGGVIHHIDGFEQIGLSINTAFRRERYHTPFDEADQGFDFGAGVSHAQVNFLTGLYVAMQDARPAWNDGDFFGKLFGGGGR